MDLASATAFYRSAPTRASITPVFIHGVPTSSDIWTAVLARTGGVALDLPGFGRSDKGGHLDYSLPGLARATAELIEALELGPVALVGHGWGAAVALETAAGSPVARLALIEPGPAGAPSRLERAWRTPLLGELAMGALTRRGLARMLRARASSAQAWPEDRVAAAWDQFDQGTQRAILRLYRSTEPNRLQALAARVPAIETLILHGEKGGAQAQRLAGLLTMARAQAVPGAGHWPWLDRPETVDTIAEFLA